MTETAPAKEPPHCFLSHPMRLPAAHPLTCNWSPKLYTHANPYGASISPYPSEWPLTFKCSLK